MSQLGAEKFNVAWFKLAEFVVRKEKERALVIYRLLVHSLPEDAMRLQLEGDLLLAFNDSKAISCYIKAAELYERDRKLIEAIGAFKHCLALSPTHTEFILALIRLNLLTKNNAKVIYYLETFLQLSSPQAISESFFEMFETQSFTTEQRLDLLELFIMCCLSGTDGERSTDIDALIKPINTILNHHSSMDDSKRLSQFLAKISGINTKVYEYCGTYLSQDQRQKCDLALKNG